MRRIAPPSKPSDSDTDHTLQGVSSDALGSSLRACRCPVCGEVFEGVTGFDDHRAGSFEPAARHCRTAAEMQERGWEINEWGRWGQPTPRGDHTD